MSMNRENLCYSVDSAFSFPSDDTAVPWQHPPNLSITAKPRQPIKVPALIVPFSSFLRGYFTTYDNA